MSANLRKQFSIAGCLYFGQMIAGYTLGWPAPVVLKLQDPEQTPFDNVLTDVEASWIVSVSFLGTIPGPYISGYLSNVIGRKPCLYIGGGLNLLGYTLMALAVHVFMIYAGRIICGVGNGIIFVTNLVYIGEMASTNIRGTLLTLTGFFSTCATLLVYSVAPFVSYAVACWLAIAMTGIYLAGLFFVVPETAVYHVMAGEKEKAIANLTSLGRKDDIDEVVAKANEKPKSNLAQMTELYTINTNRRALFIILVLNILQEASGFVVVTSFVTSIFASTGSSMESHISTIIIGVTQVGAASIAPLLVDRSGRKILILFSTAACSISMAALGIYFYLYNTNHPAADKLQWLSLVSLILFYISYFSGLGIIPNTFIGEMFTDNVRSFASTFTVTVGWLFGFGVATAFGYMVTAWGADVTFWMYSGACAFAFFFSVVFVPETKGKSLSEIRKMLAK